MGRAWARLVVSLRLRTSPISRTKKWPCLSTGPITTSLEKHCTTMKGKQASQAYLPRDLMWMTQIIAAGRVIKADIFLYVHSVRVCAVLSAAADKLSQSMVCPGARPASQGAGWSQAPGCSQQARPLCLTAEETKAKF